MKIFELNSIPQDVLPKVGGKAKGLFKLSECGLNIGKGFVITDIKSEEDVSYALDYYKKSGLKKVAVRSSANNEDGAEFSSAGQYKTFLNVAGDSSFVKAVRGCLKSLTDKEAAVYSENFKAAKSTEMSVVVQGMVDAVKAGVGFSINPIGNKTDMLIEVVEGLGESLVSGESDSLQYVVPREKVKDKSLAIGDINNEGLLKLSEINEIISGTLTAEKHLNMPVDTEWAIGRDGILIWLQARAITTLEEVDIKEFDTKRDVSKDLMTTCNIGEMLPGAASPLAITSTIKSVDVAMRNMMESSGAYKKGRNRELKDGDCIMSFYNTQFLNMSKVYKMAYSVLGAGKGDIELSICGRHLDYELNAPKVNGFVKFVHMFSYFSYLLGIKKARRRIDRLVEKLDTKQFKSDDLNEQYDIITKLLPKLDRAFCHHFVMSAHSGAMSSALFRIVDSKINDYDKSKTMIAPLLEDIDGIESVDILRSMRAVARAAISDNPDVKKYNHRQLTEYFRSCAGETREKLDAFLSRHGHRAIREIEVRSKSWNNDEDGLIENLKTVISTGGEEVEKMSNANKTIEEFSKGYKGLLKKVVGYLIKQARRGVVNREYTKSKSIKVADYIKTGYINLARLMVDEALLPEEDLIYFLTHEEIKKVIEKDSSLIKKAIARRRLFPQQVAMEFDDVFVGFPKPIENIVIEGVDTIKGMPISRGIVTGKARVVKSFEDAAKLEKGEVMVAAFTDIGWSPFYCLVGGLITERGSALSHGAVVAREYSLPLVSSVANATQLIKTGDMIKLDANSGIITILA